jgi:predicted ribosome quality control (RQC) complex YloA/Tae2 family protein
MSNSQPIDEINVKLNDFGTQLEQLGDEIDLLRTIQDANRRELRFTSQSLARLERIVTQLADTVRNESFAAAADRQQAAIDRQIFQNNFNEINQRADRDREQIAIDRQIFQNKINEINQRSESDRAEIRRIWEYLSSQSTNSRIQPE